MLSIIREFIQNKSYYKGGFNLHRFV